jgi:hypothetical protein
MSGHPFQSNGSNLAAFSQSVAVPTFDPFEALNLHVNAPCSQLSLWQACKTAQFQTTAYDVQRQTEIAHAYNFLRANGMVNVDHARLLWPGRAAHSLVPRRRRTTQGRISLGRRRRQLRRSHVGTSLAATETRVGTFLAATERIEGLMGLSLMDYPILLHLVWKLRCSCWECCETLCGRCQMACGACQTSGSLEDPIVIDDCGNSVKVYKE